jgi:hypothetical protein
MLPNKLKVELSVYIFKDLFKTILFLRQKNSSFLAWICPLFIPLVLDGQKYIYFEGDMMELANKEVDCWKRPRRQRWPRWSYWQEVQGFFGKSGWSN